ncbi:Fe-S cluster assembly protein SufD [Shimazuella sp. AN120528]|uniref:Fe-S cluster assembly protein SufD n=1 Tax=Shimazuella soli TaxID=1892854 RepID=UPI001F10F38D|nr:Fe-S cluster assembly protein SufD [Shimazuella soli]MCH5585646.1 Fe-S cluster assembly protein SufD [Shimazuella soli]
MSVFSREQITQLSQSQNEPKWALEKRLEAFSAIDSLPLPKLEKTNIDRWNFSEFQLYQASEKFEQAEELPDAVSRLILEESNVLVQKNDAAVYQTEKALDQGVIFTSLQTAYKQHETLLKKYLFRQDTTDRVAAIHQAFTQGGAFIYVPRNVSIKLPLQAVFWLDGKNAGMFPHVLIVAEENSRVEIVTNFLSTSSDAAVSNSVIEAFVGHGAKVQVATVSHFGNTVVDVMNRFATVGRDGDMEWIVADLSDGRIISKSTTNLKETGGHVDVKSVAFGAGEMRSNITSEILHFGTHTTSDIQARSVMKDKATSIINSITKIEKGASKSDGQQTGKVLMLDPEARGDANPILLIDENDVTAGHAASVGRIDPLTLFYLMSRGISKEEASKLIIRGFLDTIIADIPSAPLRESIHETIEGKFTS